MASHDGTPCAPMERSNKFAIEAPSPSKEIIFLVVMCSAQGTVLGCLAQGILPGRLIGKTFGASNDEIAWFPAAYGLTTGIFTKIRSLHIPLTDRRYFYAHRRSRRRHLEL